MSTGIFYDLSIWEEIRFNVEGNIYRLVETIGKGIPNDRSLAQFQGKADAERKNGKLSNDYRTSLAHGISSFPTVSSRPQEWPAFALARATVY